MSNILNIDIFRDEANIAISPETSMYADISKEALEAFGTLVKYVPRYEVSVNETLNEVDEFSSNASYEFPVFFENGQVNFDTMNTAFGFTMMDTTTLSCDRSHFASLSIPDRSEPLPGDLIIVPINNIVLEISEVPHRRDFTDIKHLISFTMRCKIYTSDGDTITTDGADIAIDTLLSDIISPNSAYVNENNDFIESVKPSIVTENIIDKPFGNF